MVSIESALPGTERIGRRRVPTCEFWFTKNAPSAFDIPISKSNGIVTIAGYARVNPGMKSGIFSILANPVRPDSSVALTAQTATSSLSRTVYVKGNGAYSLKISPTSVVGGARGTVLGTVTLYANAPTGGAVVTLSKTGIGASVPASVTIPAGSKTGTFIISHSAVQITSIVNVKATYNSITATANLLVTP